MEKNFQDFSQAELLSLLRSPAGQKLISMLQQQHGALLQQAMTMVMSGRQEEARRLMEPVLQSEQTQQLFKQMGGNHG